MRQSGSSITTNCTFRTENVPAKERCVTWDCSRRNGFLHADFGTWQHHIQSIVDFQKTSTILSIATNSGNQNNFSFFAWNKEEVSRNNSTVLPWKLSTVAKRTLFFNDSTTVRPLVDWFSSLPASSLSSSSMASMAAKSATQVCKKRSNKIQTLLWQMHYNILFR